MNSPASGQRSEAPQQGPCEHIAGCAQCQELLKALSEDAVLLRQAPECWPPETPPPSDPALSRLLEKLRITPPPAALATDDGAEAQDTTLGFLGPPAHAGDLGTLGAYRILKELGRGGMGIVFLAYDPSLRRTVALKVLPPERADARARARFVREAQAAAGIEHDNVVPVHLVADPADGPPYLVMPYVEGLTLRERIKTEGRLDPRDAARICQQMAEGLAAAHRAGLIHRDIKPGNVMLERGAGRAKIMDFGLVRILSQPGGTTQEGSLPGTPDYMSPEQVRQPDRIDTRSDIYSLGVTLYEALTGEVPFRGVAHMVLQQIVDDEPRPPRRLNDKIPRDLETICLCCLHKEPGRRYPSAGALAADLRHFLAGEPIRARPVRAWERVAKWVKRRPAIAALLALVLIITVSGFGLVTWQWNLAETARGELLDKAKELADRARQLEIKNYVRNIALAANELAMGNTGRAEEVLDECPQDLRRWEWHYLKRRIRDFPPLTLPHGMYISGGKGFDFAFSPDGRLLAAPCGESTIKIWEMPTGKELPAFRGHRGNVLRVAFSPDSRRLASASEDATISIWDTKTGRETTLRGHTGPVNGLAFSPLDGRYLASTSRDQTVRLWDAITGDLLDTFPSCFTRNIVVTVAFSPDGRRLAASGEDNTVKVWDVMSRREIATLRGHTDQVFSVGFSPDGQRLCSVGWDGSAKVWDVTQSREIFTVREHSLAAWGVAFSADGRRLAVAEATPACTVKVYDALTGQSVFTLEGHSTRVVSVAFSPDGRRLVSGSLDKTVKLWEMETGQELLTLREHTNLVAHVAFDTQGRRLASSSDDGTIRIWDASGIEESSDHQIRTLRGHAGMVWSVAFSTDGKSLASAGADKLVKVWDVTTGRQVFALAGHEDAVLSIAFNQDGKRLASASNDKSVKIWNIEQGRAEGANPLIRTLNEFRGGVRCVAFSPDGLRLVTADFLENVQVWKAETGQVVFPLRGHKNFVRVVTFSPDGSIVAGCSVDGKVRRWNAATGQEMRPLPHSSRVLSLAYSPDNELLASGDADQTVKVWEAATGNEVLSLSGHTNYVMAVAFSSDGRRLASASWHEVIVWDTKTG
jgi:WD40 repeat protein